MRPRGACEYTGTGREAGDRLHDRGSAVLRSRIYVVLFRAPFFFGLAAERLQAFASLPLFSLILYVSGQLYAVPTRARPLPARPRTIFRARASG
jgi:hypothetical protein